MDRAGGAAVIVVMGVSGSGKTTVGKLLAERLGWEYADADDLHPKSNLAKMATGVPLDDADRLPWLRRTAAWIREHLESGRPGVVTCSALKRRYRELLAVDPDRVRLVYLHGDKELITRRMTARKGHFFAPAMLDSQFRDLEPPTPDENVLWVSVESSLEEIVKEILAATEKTR